MAKSKMIKCGACSEEIAKTAKTCPKCGAKNKKRPKTGCAVVLLALGLGWMAIDGMRGANAADAGKYIPIAKSQALEAATLGEVLDSTVNKAEWSFKWADEIPVVEFRGVFAPVGGEQSTLFVQYKVDESNNTATFHYGTLDWQEMSELEYSMMLSAIQLHWATAQSLEGTEEGELLKRAKTSGDRL